MASLVTQDEALRQLRLSAAAISSEELLDVMFKAEQASAIIVDYLKRPFDDTSSPAATTLVVRAAPRADETVPEPVVPWTEATCPTHVKAVILIVLTALYDGRTPDDELLSNAVTSILWRSRDPALA